MHYGGNSKAHVHGGRGVLPPSYSQSVTPEVGGGMPPPTFVQPMTPRSVDFAGGVPSRTESVTMLGAQVELSLHNVRQ